MFRKNYHNVAAVAGESRTALYSTLSQNELDKFFGTLREIESAVRPQISRNADVLREMLALVEANINSAWQLKKITKYNASQSRAAIGISKKLLSDYEKTLAAGDVPATVEEKISMAAEGFKMPPAYLFKAYENALKNAVPAKKSPLEVLKNKVGASVRKWETTKNKILESFCPYVSCFANKNMRRSNRSSYSDDLMQEILIRISDCIDRFDVGAGIKFSTFIHPWLKKCLQDISRESRIVKIPENAQKSYDKIAKTMLENDCCFNEAVAICRERKILSSNDLNIVRDLRACLEIKSLNENCISSGDETLTYEDIFIGEEEDEMFDRLEAREKAGLIFAA
ncbi:MAG: hypothetical protein K6B46_05590 [Opitutales bacterium]|nr:hypothetical protein [Opitutales bacterium]